jgi:hypothetical protein
VTRTGDVTGAVTENGGKLQVLGVGGKVYVQATPAFLRQVKAPASSCSIVCGRWIQLPPNEAGQLTGQLNMNHLLGNVPSASTAKFTEAGSTTVNGQSAWVLRAPDGTQVDVASSGTPYPLEAKTGNGKQGTIDFTQWNSVPSPSAPPANKVINLNGLH